MLNFKTSTLDIKEVGQIREVRKSIARITGFPSCINGQLVRFKSGVCGMVMGFTEKDTIVLILGDDSSIRAGEEAVSQSEPFKIPVGSKFIGRIVNCLAEPRDEGGNIGYDTFYPVFRDAPPIIDRIPLTEQMYTGTKIIDNMIPLAKGQRELIIGDRMTGKTTIAVDAILNQKGKDVVCIYCCVGRNFFSLLKTVQLFKNKGAMDYTIVVAAPASSPAGEQFLIPYTASAMGEYFMDHGRDVLLVFDDLTRHAWVYRQISLLLERSPGREAYPGDVFYIHSQLMERAGRLNEKCGGGSMTFLPILETQQGDVTDHISSNIVSMTDGQIYTSSQLFNEGFKPAIDLGLSVSRIGSKVHKKSIKEVSGQLRLEYLQYRELVRLTRMKAKLSDSIEKRIKKGVVLSTILKQNKNNPLAIEEQIILFYAFKRGILEILSDEGINKFKGWIFEFMRDTNPHLIGKLITEGQLTEDIKKGLDSCFIEFIKSKQLV